MDHAPEPWDVQPYVDAIDIVDAHGHIVAEMANRRIGIVGMPPDNARRIMKAVNACAGLTPEQIEAIPALIEWFVDPPKIAEAETEYRHLCSIFPRRETPPTITASSPCRPRASSPPP